MDYCEIKVPTPNDLWDAFCKNVYSFFPDIEILYSSLPYSNFRNVVVGHRYDGSTIAIVQASKDYRRSDLVGLQAFLDKELRNCKVVLVNIVGQKVISSSFSNKRHRMFSYSLDVEILPVDYESPHTFL
jgi:hypothetical protein